MTSRFALGLVASAVLLGLLFWKIPIQEVWAALAQAHRLGLAITLLLHLVVLSLKAVRWKVVLGSLAPASDSSPGGDRPTSRPRWLAFDALFLGYFGNYVLPAKLGELGRSLLYSRRAGLPFPSVLATIVFERFLDALVLILAFYAIVFGAGLPDDLPNWVSRSARIVGALSLVGLGTLSLWARGSLPGIARALSGGRLASLRARVGALLETFRTGLAVLKQPGIAAMALAWTIAIWTLEMAAVWLCLWSFGCPVHWTGAALQVVIASFAIAPPSAPGGLGIHQWVTVVVLAPYGVGASQAAAASLVLTIAVVIWVVPLGLHGLWRQGSSTRELQTDFDKLQEPGRGP